MLLVASLAVASHVKRGLFASLAPLILLVCFCSFSAGAVKTASGQAGMGISWVQPPGDLWTQSMSHRSSETLGFDSIPLQTPRSNGFNHGFKVVRNGFRPSTVCVPKYHPMSSPAGAPREGFPCLPLPSPPPQWPTQKSVRVILLKLSNRGKKPL